MADNLTDALNERFEKNEKGLGYHHIENISGAEVQVIFEFPTNDVQESLYIHMGTLVTVSHSVARSKLPVYLLGDTTMSGIALGNKMVAGSIVKLYTRNDPLTQHIKRFVDARFEKIEKERLKTFGNMVDKLSYKEMSEYMRDDISPFNIHMVTMSESDIEVGQKFGVDTIIGATIINTGNVFSIENLISEETISFVAREVKYQTDVTKARSNFTSSSVVTASSLLNDIRG